jgi:hypothetical protein
VSDYGLSLKCGQQSGRQAGWQQAKYLSAANSQGQWIPGMNWKHPAKPKA